MASFCRKILLWGSFDRILFIYFKKNKICENIAIFAFKMVLVLLLPQQFSLNLSKILLHSAYFSRHHNRKKSLFSKYFVSFENFMKKPFQCRAARCYAIESRVSRLIRNFFIFHIFGKMHRNASNLSKWHFLAIFARSHSSEILSCKTEKEFKISGKIYNFGLEWSKNVCNLLNWSQSTKHSMKKLIYHSF